ncbi:hypothetical protein EPUS_01769 [Endocarpon pusillum Z07020]|uniref:Calpain catalytic domain-containing protein n=1 Tax=Endocarpon pusillum (strain Z07020 / HMAS-L-300199) TaxID=1263415 RepID=U1HRS8_ENDPU|nr:uncharacterized protein EPUS_01769 [Endocarpon pusillum Z07020]ERF71854.1 hypothetical protein EPUS_01769 [Endocarpon pusillum Z07020]
MSVHSDENDDVHNTVALPIQISLNANQRRKEPPPPPRKIDKHTPQESINRFWSKFYAKYPGKVFTVLPENPYAQKKIAKVPNGVAQAQRAVRSYEQAREECIRDVKRIIRECRRVNQKYRDPHFDIEWDLKKGRRYCLEGLEKPDEDYNPKAVKRVTDIFEDPQFFIHGPTAGDVIQGNDGDCYLMAALCGLGNMSGLINKICVIHDQAVGVYGFVFHRDGEWQQCIIDDQLYMTAPDYDESNMERIMWDTIARRDTEEEYRRTHQTGSRSLYFAKCSEPNETWLPLLEKAYAKAHGDYASISGGWTGEAIEDLTGGVTSEIYSSDILDKNEFWVNELLKVGKEFLYGCSTGQHADWLEPNRPTNRRQGIHEGHAYSIMDAVEHTIDGITYRLVKVRNPWGNTGWSGAWSDGSAEWTPQWMERLNHKFGDDGIFWMSYEDLLRKYQRLDRTRIFGPDWRITQQFTSLHVPWSADYHQTRFSVNVTRTTPVVIVLSQLDKTYFAGLQGQYNFKLQFRVQRVGDEEDYIVRSNVDYYMTRSVSTDITLEAGSYFVLMKVTATRVGGPTMDEIISAHAEHMRDKLIQVGLSYDIAHAKGVIVETEKEVEQRQWAEKAQAAAAREKLKNEVKARKEKVWMKEKKSRQRRKMQDRKHEEKAAEQRSRERGDGYQSDKKNFIDRSECHSSNVGNGQATADDDRSFAEELNSSHERSEGAQTSTTSDPKETPIESPANNTRQSPRSNDAVADKDSTTSSADKTLHDHPPTPKVQVNGIDAVTDVNLLKRRPAPLAPRTTLDGKLEMKDQDKRENQQEADPFTEPQWSNSDTESKFSWRTDLDYDSDEARSTYARSEQGRDWDAGEESGPEPWNAVCVVGLRVYSKDPDLSLEVVRPHPYSEVIKPEAGSALDRDDPAKGAVAEKWAKTPLRGTFDSE